MQLGARVIGVKLTYNKASTPATYQRFYAPKMNRGKLQFVFHANLLLQDQIESIGVDWDHKMSSTMPNLLL